LKTMFHLGFSIPRHMKHPLHIVGIITGLAILLVIGSVALQQQLSKLTIYIRRAWGLIYTYLFVSTGIALIAVSSVNAEWLIAIPALSILITHAFYFEKSKRFSNFTFYFSLLLLIGCQLIINR